MYLSENEIHIKSYDHLIELWNSGNWYFNSVSDDQVTISDTRPDVKTGYPFWFHCSKEWFLSLDETITVTAFIFHVSRCGSTLCSNLLDIPDNQICLNEPGLFSWSIINNQDMSQYLSRMNGKRQDVIIKTSSWNICFIDEIKSLYPDSKTIFIYRDPVEVITSFFNKSNGWIDDDHILKLIGVKECDRLIRFAKCLEVFMSRSDFDLILPYRNLINETIYGRLHNLLGYQVDEEKMIKVSKVNSKKQGLYIDDSEQKLEMWNDVKHFIPDQIIKNLKEKENDISYIC